MNLAKPYRATAHRFPVGRIAATTFAIGGLTTSVFAINPAGAATSHAVKSVVVSTAKNAKLGTLLVSGKTLYTLAPSKTACSSACTKIWPELTLPKVVTKAVAGTGVSAATLGTVLRAGGIRQVTYNGKALYWFSGDKAAGQVHGNVTDTWGKWSDIVTVKPAKSSSSGGATNTGTGGAAF